MIKYGYLSIESPHVSQENELSSCKIDFKLLRTFLYFVSEVLCLISSSILILVVFIMHLWDLRLLKNLFHFFDYLWKDKNKITTILGIHLILLGIGTFLLAFKTFYFGGAYDTRAQ